jgi:hypothetical protein
VAEQNEVLARSGRGVVGPALFIDGKFTGGLAPVAVVGDLFEYHDLGAFEVKGIAGPVPAWQVLHPSAVASRFEALRKKPSFPRDGRVTGCSDPAGRGYPQTPSAAIAPSH